jgi:serine protease Do
MSDESRQDIRLRKPLVSFLMVLFILTLGIGIGTLITYRVGAVGQGGSQLRIQTDGKPVAGNAVLALSQAFAEVAKHVEPAVVNINTEEVVRVSQRRRSPGGGQGDEMPDDLFHRFMPNLPNLIPQIPEQFTRQSLGSGVIVDPKGYIITNNHVVDRATKIKVNVTGGKEYTAKVIGADELSDIAVIKIDGDGDFPVAKVGDAKAMKVGDWVLAIGSPFGLDQSVTAGIISTTGRVFDGRDAYGMDSMLFNDYLQTDAAINPGNSGGPLVNMNGEVVGINSFISTRSQQNAGVGFAVPSHIFANVYNQILQKGKVQRGVLGVNMNPLPFTPEMAKYFGVKQGGGVLITKLTDEAGRDAEKGPAERAGIKVEDVITEFDGKKVLSMQDLRMAVANTPPGRKATVKVVRHGEEKTFQVTVSERKIEAANAARDQGGFSLDEEKVEPKPKIGLTIDEVPQNLARELSISGGAIVTAVEPGSYAEDAGLIGQDRGGADIIVEANGNKVSQKSDLVKVFNGLKSGEGVVLRFLRVNRGPDNRLASSTYYTSVIKP